MAHGTDSHVSVNGTHETSNGTSKHQKCRLFVVAESAKEGDFDQASLRLWREEGFEVTYLPFSQGGEQFAATLRSLDKSRELREKFAVIAFGKAATECLHSLRQSPPPRGLCALVAYYPTAISDTQTGFESTLRVLVHLAGGEVGETPASGGPNVDTGRKRKGLGKGRSISDLAFPSYSYLGAEPGFAEHDLPEYDKASERLARTRTLEVLRKAFEMEVDIEKIWEEHMALEFLYQDPAKTMETMVEEPYVNHIPVITGAVGRDEVHRFYSQLFIGKSPESTKIKLISRTIGADKIVDEMLVSFDHTCEMDWMLPGVPPTGKHVEVAAVGVVGVRGGKVASEHIYWDQATILVQVGLLDPKLVPQQFKDMGVERLPVLGAVSAKKVEDETSVPSNPLNANW